MPFNVEREVTSLWGHAYWLGLGWCCQDLHCSQQACVTQRRTPVQGHLCTLLQSLLQEGLNDKDFMAVLAALPPSPARLQAQALVL